MTSRERILAAVWREPVDYVPWCVVVSPLTPVQRRGHTRNFPWPSDIPYPQQLRYQGAELGLYQVVSCGVVVTREHPQVTCEVRVEGDVLRKVYHTPAGDLQAMIRYNDQWPHGADIPLFSDFNIGHFIEPWLKIRQDLDCLDFVFRMLDPQEALDRARPGVEAQRGVALRWELCGVGVGGLGLTGAQQLFGIRELCLLTVGDP